LYITASRMFTRAVGVEVIAGLVGAAEHWYIHSTFLASTAAD